MTISRKIPLPTLDEQTPWRIGICSSGGELAGTAFVIRKSDHNSYVVELELPAPVPNGIPDDLFVLAPEGDEMQALLEELCPLWLPPGTLSDLAYKRHFPKGLPIEEL